jgi:hypothetical protein
MRIKLSLAIATFAFYCTLFHGQTSTIKSASEIGPKAASALAPISSAKAAKIEELLKLNGVQSQMLQVNKQAQESLRAYARREAAILPQVLQEEEPKLKQLTTAYIAKEDEYVAEITWAKLKPSLVRSYAENFTEGQIESLVAFYKTPSGKDLAEKQTTLNEAIQNSIQDLQSKIVPKTYQATNDLKEEVHKKFHQKTMQK